MTIWMTTGEVGKMIGRSPAAVRDLLEHERFDYFEGAYRLPGGAWRVPRTSVVSFLKRMQEAAKTVHRRKTG